LKKFKNFSPKTGKERKLQNTSDDARAACGKTATLLPLPHSEKNRAAGAPIRGESPAWPQISVPVFDRRQKG